MTQNAAVFMDAICGLVAFLRINVDFPSVPIPVDASIKFDKIPGREVGSVLAYRRRGPELFFFSLMGVGQRANLEADRVGRIFPTNEDFPILRPRGVKAKGGVDQTERDHGPVYLR